MSFSATVLWESHWRYYKQTVTCSWVLTHNFSRILHFCWKNSAKHVNTRVQDKELMRRTRENIWSWFRKTTSCHWGLKYKRVWMSGLTSHEHISPVVCGGLDEWPPQPWAHFPCGLCSQNKFMIFIGVKPFCCASQRVQWDVHCGTRKTHSSYSTLLQY